MSAADDALEIYGAAQLAQSFGVSVGLYRGGSLQGTLSATWEAVDYEVIDLETGFPTKITMRDFTLAIADLPEAMQTLRAGDQIGLTESGSAVLFEMVPVGRRPAAELLPGGSRWIVRTKKVG